MSADFDTALVYQHPKFRGVALRFSRWERVWEPYTCLVEGPGGSQFEEDTGEGEWIDDPSTGRCYVRMVGDDHLYLVYVDELEPLPEEFCGSCGQIGCGWC